MRTLAYKPDVVAHACNPSPGEVGDAAAWGHLSCEPLAPLTSSRA